MTVVIIHNLLLNLKKQILSSIEEDLGNIRLHKKQKKYLF